MNMKRLLTLVAFFATVQASAQQVNPVPDYVFANRMSAGRNTVTDTAAYFSIGPRYGATRGMMPPMVVDTASFSANKRNGLLIFSVQKNKFLYWDSIGVKWAEMAGTGGSAITGSGVAGYMPEFTTTTNLDTTRLYHSAGRFSIGSTTTSNGVFNVYGAGSYFDTLLRVGKGDILVGGTYNPHGATNNSSIVLNGSLGGALGFTNGVRQKAYIYSDTTDLYLRTVSSGRLLFGTRDSTRMLITTDGRFSIAAPASTFLQTARFNISDNSGDLMRVETSGGSQRLFIGQDTLYFNTSSAGVIRFARNNTSTAFINSSSEFLVNTETDAGSYSLQVAGSIYNTTGAVFAASSGSVGIGTTSPNYKLSIKAATDYNIGIGILGSFASINVLNDASSAYKELRIDANTILINTYSGGETLLNTSTDAGNYKLQVSGNIYNTGSITTGAPSGGSIKPWKIGEAATVSPTSPNRTIRVEIDGTVYYLHAKTTND